MSSYQEYLKSDVWQILRKQRLAMDNGECVLCAKQAENVHHRRYPNVLGTETVNDLVSLCQACHAKHHDKPVNQKVIKKKVVEQKADGRVTLRVYGCCSSLAARIRGMGAYHPLIRVVLVDCFAEADVVFIPKEVDPGTLELPYGLPIIAYNTYMPDEISSRWFIWYGEASYPDVLACWYTKGR